MQMHLGRRALTKQRTHRAIRRTAMRLFIERGFDDVTTTEIATSSDVSSATLFNYFATKEDLFFGQVEELEQRLRRVVSGCRPGESILAALQGHVLYELTAGRVHSDPAAVAPFHRAVVQSVRLQAREAQIYQRRQAVLVEALTAALGADHDPVLARVAAAQYVAAEKVIAHEMRERLESGAPAATLSEMEPYIARVFSIMGAGLGDLPGRAVSGDSPP